MNVCLFCCSLYLVCVLCARLYSVVMSGEVACCSVVCGTLVGVSVFNII